MPSAFGKPVTTANRFGVVTATAAQSMTLVTTLTASLSASLSYTGFSSTSYKSYRLVFNRILTENIGADLYVNASVDGGVNYGALWTGGIIRWNNSSVWARSDSSGVTNFPIVMNSDNSTTNGGVYGELMFNYSPVAGTAPALTGLVGDRNDSSDLLSPSIIHGIYNNATEVNALKFKFSALNIASGTIKIYGIT